MECGGGVLRWHVARQNAEGERGRAPNAPKAMDEQMGVFGQVVDKGEGGFDGLRARRIRLVRIGGVAEKEFQMLFRRQLDHREQSAAGSADRDQVRWRPERAIVSRFGL
ncbi:hypothetical protein D9M70_603180 [compost metagenome]